MEASALQHAGAAGLHGRSPLLRLQSDERLVALIRRGNHHAFEALVARYQSRLLAFCRHMLSSREDAEDVLQEVFAAAFNAMLADEREINVRPWLYRIARNRSLNHLRRTQAVGMDSMDVHLSEGGLTTADKVHKREEFRLLIADVQDLPETQRTALLLREIDALSYDQIAEAMETTVPSVKSLLVRARVSLAEAAEARLLSCEEVRLELGEVAEGLTRTSAPVRRHLRTCERCVAFRKALRSNNRAMAALYPIGPLVLFKKLLLTHLGASAAASSAGTAGAAAGSAGAGAALQVGFGTVASKAVAGLAAAAIVTAGAVEVQHAAKPRAEREKTQMAQVKPVQTAVPPAPTAVPTVAPVLTSDAPQASENERGARKVKLTPENERKLAAPDATPTSTPGATPTGTPTPTPTAEGHGGDTTALPTDTLGTAQPGSGSYTPPATGHRPDALLRFPHAGRDAAGHRPGDRSRGERDAHGAARADARPDAGHGFPHAHADGHADAARGRGDAGRDAARRSVEGELLSLLALAGDHVRVARGLGQRQPRERLLPVGGRRAQPLVGLVQRQAVGQRQEAVDRGPLLAVDLELVLARGADVDDPAVLAQRLDQRVEGLLARVEPVERERAARAFLEHGHDVEQVQLALGRLPDRGRAEDDAVAGVLGLVGRRDGQHARADRAGAQAEHDVAGVEAQAHEGPGLVDRAVVVLELHLEPVPGFAHRDPVADDGRGDQPVPVVALLVGRGGER